MNRMFFRKPGSPRAKEALAMTMLRVSLRTPFPGEAISLFTAIANALKYHAVPLELSVKQGGIAATLGQKDMKTMNRMFFR